MREILAIAVNDLRLMSRNWLGMFFIIGFPVMMGIFFGTIMGSVGEDHHTMVVAVVDEDQSPMSQRFITELSAGSDVQVEKEDRTKAMDDVRRGRLVGMIVLPKGFGETAGMMWLKSPAIEVGTDPSHKAESGMLQGNIMQAMGKLAMIRFKDPASVRTIIERAREQVATSGNVPIALQPALAQIGDSFDTLLTSWEADIAKQKSTGSTPQDKSKGPEFEIARIEKIDVTHPVAKGSHEDLVRRIRSRWDISFPQAMQWGVLACVAGFAVSIVRERKQGTLLRLQVAPITRTQIVAGKAAACFIAVLSVIALMTSLGVWLGMRPESPGLVVLASLAIAVCFVGIMILMSVVGKTEEAVSGAAWGSNMLLAMFGGGMVPLLFMPSFMRTLSNFSPVKWSIVALEGAIWRGFSLNEMLLPCTVLVAVGVVCFAIGSVVLSRTTN